MTEPIISLRLYIAGQSPNSSLAVSNLKALLSGLGPTRHSLEVIDVFRKPDRALQDGVLLTPLLRIQGLGATQSVIGNLSQAEVVLQAIGRAREEQ